MTSSDSEAGFDLARLVDAVETDLLGGPRRYTRLEIAERAGIGLDDIRSLWRALGFAATSDDARNFTDADLDALANVHTLERVGGIDDDVMHAITRIIGQSFARLASWQGQLILEIIERNPDLLADGSPDRVLALVDELVPVVSRLQDYVWRRQLAAYFARIGSNAAATGAAVPSATMAVGFVDMADFTTFTRRSSESDLRAVLDAFETLSTDVVSAHDGQIVKTIGDEVLFVAPEPGDAADIALALVAGADADPVLPQVRAGVAYGEVVRRLGDVFGQTVNIASRLTSIARTNSVLVDEGLADELRGNDRYVLHTMRTVAVRGYRHLRPARLRAAGDGPEQVGTLGA